MTFWTTERTDALRVLVAAKDVAAIIAVKLGCSRNAVIGKIDRLGLGVGLGGVGSRRGARKTYVRKPSVVSLPKPPTVPIIENLSEEAMAATVTTLDLAPEHCKWPVNDGKPFWLHCGQQRTQNTPYCEAHAKRAFNIQPKREKAA